MRKSGKVATELNPTVIEILTLLLTVSQRKSVKREIACERGQWML